MKRLNSPCLLILRAICYKYSYFEKKGGLDPAGSFYYEDERLAAENLMSKKTVARAVRFLQKENLIWCERGIYKGRATRYKPFYQAFILARVKTPEALNQSVKGAQQSSKGCPVDAPKELKKELKKEEVFLSPEEEQEKIQQEVEKFRALRIKLTPGAQKSFHANSDESGEAPPCSPK